MSIKTDLIVLTFAQKYADFFFQCTVQKVYIFAFNLFPIESSFLASSLFYSQVANMLELPLN